MKTNLKQNTAWWRSYYGIGVAVTVVYVLFVSVWLWEHITPSDSFSQGRHVVQLNIVGDFISGICAPLAFLWFLMSMLQTSRALHFQQQELKASVTEMQAGNQTAHENAKHIQRDVFLAELKVHMELIKAAMELINTKAHDMLLRATPNNIGRHKYLHLLTESEEQCVHNMKFAAEKAFVDDIHIKAEMMLKYLNGIVSEWYKEPETHELCLQYIRSFQRILTTAKDVDEGLHIIYVHSSLGKSYKVLCEKLYGPTVAASMMFDDEY